MDLIERYVLEVEEHLPYKTGNDVAAELRSLLSDSLEERAARAGRPPDEEMAVELLREFGEPEEVAGRYGEPRYLIGPRLYPTFIYVAIAIIIIPAVLTLLGNTIAWVVNGRVFHLASIGKIIWDYVQGTFVSLGLAVLVFAIIERTTTVDSSDEQAGKKDWDPRELPPLTTIGGEERVSIGHVEYGLWGNIIGLVLLNFFPQWLGLPWGWQYRWLLVPFADFGIPLPVALLNIYWVSSLVLDVLLLRGLRWTRWLRWAEFGVGVVGLATLILILVLSHAPSIDSAWLIAHGWLPGEHLAYLLSAIGKLNRIARGVLWAMPLWQVWQSAVRLWYLVAPTPAPEDIP